eukprot:TRINITY_DN135110_c0_g1_i1.p2 TRINITY_DN135110_c0_g1~~TRINITY_DN135110_c0_g1_i1.p2  ORF type:complete len:270 (+),score=11.36 TRINITY_DN135110_c0_g1_i1:85-810(+)
MKERELKITTKIDKKPKEKSKSQLEDTETLRQLKEKVKKYSKDVSKRVNSLQSLFKDYSDLIENKLQHLNIMQDYDVEFQIRQKFSNFWNTISSDKFSYLTPEDRAALDQNLRDLRDKLIKIEMNQTTQRQFLSFFCKILHYMNQTFKKREVKDAEVQVCLEGGGATPDIDKYEKAEANYLYFIRINKQETLERVTGGNSTGIKIAATGLQHGARELCELGTAQSPNNKQCAFYEKRHYLR